MPVNDILRALVPAMVITLVVLAWAWRPWRGGSPRWGGAGSALAVGVSLALAVGLYTRSWPGRPPENPDRWLGVVALIGAAWSLLANRVRRRTVRTAAAAFCVALAVGLLLWFELASPERRLGGLARLAAYTAVGTALVTELRGLAERRPGARVPLVLWAAATGLSLVMLQSGVMSSAIPAAALAVVMGWFVLLGWWRPKLGAAAPAAPVAVLYLLGVYVGAHYYAPVWSFVAILGAVGACWLGEVGPPRRLPAWTATLLAFAVAGACVAVAIGLTPGGFDFGEGGSGYEY